MFKSTVLLCLSLLVSFHVNGESMNLQDHPRYGQNPIYIFFESYIQDIIGYLPKEKSTSIQEMNIQKVFNTKSTEWHSVVKEVLHLSDTVDIAILDLWYRNREQFKTENGEYDPIWFSQIFTDEYMKEDSQVDVWPEGALDAAKQRINDAQSNN
jgi:hypothetical protein